MASSGKPLGERQLAIPPEIKIYTPERDAGGTNDHVGQGLHDHSYLPHQASMITVTSRVRPPRSQLPPTSGLHDHSYLPRQASMITVTSLRTIQYIE